MIKKIAQVINEANLVLNEQFGTEPDWRKAVDPEILARLEAGKSIDAEDIFHGEEVHKYSSAAWMQPGVRTPQIAKIVDSLPGIVKWGLSKISAAKWAKSNTPTDIVIEENLKRALRVIAKDHFSSSGQGVNSNDETTEADLKWLSQISNGDWDNWAYQILQPILKDTEFDITPELEHELVNNA